MSEGDIPEAELRRLEARWKSDVDQKLDTLIRADEERSKKYDVFLDMMIEREKARAKLRSAIIEKTLAGLIWAAIVGLLTLAFNGLQGEIKAFAQAVKEIRK